VVRDPLQQALSQELWVYDGRFIVRSRCGGVAGSSGDPLS